ncbi:MAG: RNA polymerase sigma factor [Patescibacteria group bacterium]|nr:RNA polymerase sigma factor [Patescibacteria group bacterium]MDD5490627.1 RNA polymerase sigma factor [Patescibacteria group bacterium]
MLEISDEKLVSQYLKGDEKSLEVLIQRYLKPIYGFVYYYAGTASDAEDITQDVFVKAWKHIKKFDQRKSFKTWIFSIAKNTAIDFLKKKKALLFSELSDEADSNSILDTLVDPAPLPDEILERADIEQMLARAMDKLPAKYRAVLFLYYKDGFNFREIAAVLGEPLNTVKSRQRRALLALKKILTETVE